MARKKTDIETLSEEQKARNEEIRQQQRDQLAADIAASGTQIKNDPTAKPEELNAAITYADKPVAPTATTVPTASNWQQEKLTADKAASTTQLNIRPASDPIELRQAAVYADRNQPAAEEPEKAAATEAAPAATTENNAPAETPAAESAPASQPISVDPYVAAAAQAAQDEQKSFADYVLGLRQDLNNAQAEGDQEVKNDLAAARWTGLTELASSIANMVGVGQGNAVSQQYAPQSQNWMQKADRDMKAQRSRIDNLRQRQRETELKMQQLRSQSALNMAKVQKDVMAQSALAEYRRAQAALQNAKTESERAKALRDAETAVAKMELMGAQTSAYYAQVGLRDAQAQAALMNAASRQSAVENQNKNRDSRTEAQNERDYANADKARGTTSTGRSGRSSADLIKDL